MTKNYYQDYDNQQEDNNCGNKYSYSAATNVYRRRSFKEDSAIVGLMVVGTGLMIADISIHNMVVASLAFLAAGVALMPKEANSLLCNFEKWQRKYGINVYTVLFCLVGTVFLLDMATAPANAQFLNKAEEFFKNTAYFPDIDPTIIGFIFAVLRGLFLLYLGISLVQVVQKARQDEDWQTIARTPIIVAITVVVGDTLAGLVVG
ncbi:hypothetical protein NIES4071_102380 (plasmid) [Calothrix sp. NIES-4071]|nr:hypothetical protein NIES4071_102380 [Calothrix sp. NIES-4071]BAZ64619.1 hypothetical protein NIES4105_103520 [Calothrix sp. NIES-4105]